MAHFRATIRGNRGMASRLGTKSSGIEAYVDGWKVGVRVCIYNQDGRDHIVIYRTKGSEDCSAYGQIAHISEK